MHTLSPAPAPVAREYLSFRLGGEEYGVAIEHVQELRAYTPVTALANAPASVKGVLNLRGVIVPIIDLRIAFGSTDPSYDQFTVVVIVLVRGALAGVVVDGVSDVLTLAPEQIKPVPPLQGGSAHVTGIGTLDARMLILVDIALLLDGAQGLPAALLAA